MTAFPVIVGSIENSLTEQAAFYFMAVCLVIGLAVATIFYRRERN